MISQFDVIIVGSGPAGVSAAYPLVESGMRVLMVDGGKKQTTIPQVDSYLDARTKNSDQWKWMIGEDFNVLRNLNANSPKLRIPIHRYVFEDFNEENRVITKNFESVGSLATGGLSNAWGCGISMESEEEIRKFPCEPSDLIASYRKISTRIGISGRNNDDMSSYFGVDDWSQPPIKMDDLHEFLLRRYIVQRQKVIPYGFRLGRARIAVLSEDHFKRKACNISGNCLWGCHNRALYSAIEELPILMARPNFQLIKGFIVDQIEPGINCWSIIGKNKSTGIKQKIQSRKIVLAAGTIATTRLVLNALKTDKHVRLLFSPTAAFLLWLPSLLGRKRSDSFGFAQLSYSLKIESGSNAFGWLFSTTGIPISEFSRYLPFKRPYGVEILRTLLSSCIVGNLFLPGSMSAAEAWIAKNHNLHIAGGYERKFSEVLPKVLRNLKRSFITLRAIMLPGSLKIAHPGSDIHYTGTLPMRKNPDLCQTNGAGEVHGLEGLHVVDGACLPSLSEKAHTLTIMANADRIGQVLAKIWLNKNDSKNRY